jgi:hypothetical protein
MPIYFRFRVVPATFRLLRMRLIQIAADGADANVQNRQFHGDCRLSAGRGHRYADCVPRARPCAMIAVPRRSEVEQQGTVVLMIQDFTRLVPVNALIPVRRLIKLP